jgi:penicillin-binding protein 1A
MAILHPVQAHALKQKTTGSINYVADWIMDVLDDLIGRVEDDIVVETRSIRRLQPRRTGAVGRTRDATAPSSASNRAPCLSCRPMAPCAP